MLSFSVYGSLKDLAAIFALLRETSRRKERDKRDTRIIETKETSAVNVTEKVCGSVTKRNERFVPMF